MPKIRFWGIDPSITNTGVCCFNPDDIFSPAVYEGKTFTKGLTGFARYGAEACGIANLFDNACENYVVYEDYSYGSIHNAYSLAEYGGILKYELYKAGANILFVAPTVIKRFATGNGASDKPVVAQALQDYDFPFLKNNPSNDITDACAMAMLCLFVHAPELAIEKFNKPKKLLRLRLEVAKGIKNG